MSRKHGQPWTDERLSTLTSMWSWGIGSGIIARTLGGITRNAVMGKVNRLKLMGGGGHYIGRENPNASANEAEIAQAVTDLLNEPYDNNIRLHRHAAVALACLLAGHTAQAAARILPYSEEQITDAIGAMHDAGVWVVGTAPPAQWWHHSEGRVGFMLDMMASNGAIVVTKGNDGEHAYSVVKDAR